jgi:hypothetical protein
MAEGQGRFDWPEASYEAFLRYHAENPQVYEALKHFALEAKAAGRERMGINAVHERVRWYTSVEAQHDSFKVNNSWRPFYARLLMQHVPELAGFFETRRAEADKDLPADGRAA